MGQFSDFQSAVFRALNAEPALTAIVGARIFDDVPHEKETASTILPRVTIGDQSGVEAGSDTHDAADISITLHAWSRLPGRKECLNILSAMIEALHKKQHAVAEGVLVYLYYEAHETQKDPDGETYHGIIRFNGLMQFSSES
jgi:Protein of unknown function (DUF3168)